MDPVFVKGVLAFVIALAVFVGSCWLLLAMILGARMSYFVMGSCLFGILAIIAALWVFISVVPLPSLGFGVALGPKGRETTWEPVAVAKDLQTVESEFGDFDVSDYPGGDWEAPSKGRQIVDLGKGIPRPDKKKESTLKESEALKPVIDSFVASVLSPIPGKREKVQEKVHGEIGLESGSVTLTDVRMQEAEVEEKPSLIAVGRIAPSMTIAASEFPGGVEEATIETFLVKPGDEVAAGDPLLIAKVEGGEDIELTSTADGKLLAFGLRKDDKIKPGVPFATLDLTGQPGQPDSVEIAAVRVRGSLRTPSVYYLIALTALFVLHLGGLNRLEKARKQPVPQPA